MQPPVIGVVSSTIVILPDHFDCGWSVEDAANLVELRDLNVRSWHNPDLRLAAPEGPLTSGLPTLAAEGLFSGRKPTMS
jgi:hypothetical protein